MGTIHRLPLPPRPPPHDAKRADRHEELTAYTARHDSPWELASMLFDVRDAFEHLERAEKVLELRTEQRMDTRQEIAAVRAARERIRRLLPRKMETR